MIVLAWLVLASFVVGLACAINTFTVTAGFKWGVFVFRAGVVSCVTFTFLAVALAVVVLR